MAHLIDTRNAGGEFVVLGDVLTLPSSSNATLPLPGSIRFNPTTGNVEFFGTNAWQSTVTPVTPVASSGTAQIVTFPAYGDICYDITMTADCTFAITGGTSGQYQLMTLILRQDATAGRIPTFPGTVTWAGGSVPVPNTATGVINIYHLSTPDGGATILGKN